MEMIYQYDKEDNIVGRYRSRAEAHRQTGIDRTNIGNCIKNGKRIKGYLFKVEEERVEQVVDEFNKNQSSIVKTREQKLADKIVETYTISELEQIAKGCRILPGTNHVPKVVFEGTKVKFLAAGDLHIGSIYTHDEHVNLMFAEAEKEGVDFITLGGDIVEGFSNRDGHVYEQSHIGYAQQKNHAVELLSQQKRVPMYLISGNHDRWYMKSAGADIVKEICEAIPNAIFLGHDEGDINLNDITSLKLWHGEDGNSYAHSYRIQKVIESLSGGTKPGIMLFHHVHKMVYVLERNIHCVSPGSIQMQSKWMRGKRIPAHTGFTIITLILNEMGIAECDIKFKPFYA